MQRVMATRSPRPCRRSASRCSHPCSRRRTSPVAAAVPPSPAPRAHSLTPPPTSARRACIDLAPHAQPQGRALAARQPRPWTCVRATDAGARAAAAAHGAPLTVAPCAWAAVRRAAAPSAVCRPEPDLPDVGTPPAVAAAVARSCATLPRGRASATQPGTRWEQHARSRATATCILAGHRAVARALAYVDDDVLRGTVVARGSTRSSSCAARWRPLLSPRARGDSGASAGDAALAGAPLANIWRLTGTESKSLSAFALPNHEELVGGRVGGETLRV